ncbi:MAG: hypothetical protein ACW97A_01485 [Candidatus Thorarchaeota archaeon]|jgi:hypothetical protein
MSKSLIVCGKCGLEVPQGNFCKICGEPLHDDTEQVSPILDSDESLSEQISSGSIAEDATEVFSEPEPEILPDFGFQIDGMDKKSFSILFSKAELTVVDVELDDLIEKIKSTRQALNLENADLDLLTERAERLRNAFESTKNRRNELTSVRGKLPIVMNLKELELFETKLSRLEDAKGTLDSVVYDEQRDKILRDIKRLRQGLKISIKKSKEWVKGLGKKMKDLNREGSRYDAKYKIGDISEKKYEESMRSIKRQIRIIEIGQKSLDEEIRIAEKK